MIKKESDGQRSDMVRTPLFQIWSPAALTRWKCGELVNCNSNTDQITWTHKWGFTEHDSNLHYSYEKAHADLHKIHSFGSTWNIYILMFCWANAYFFPQVSLLLSLHANQFLQKVVQNTPGLSPCRGQPILWVVHPHHDFRLFCHSLFWGCPLRFKKRA